MTLYSNVEIALTRSDNSGAVIDLKQMKTLISAYVQLCNSTSLAQLSRDIIANVRRKLATEMRNGDSRRK